MDYLHSLNVLETEDDRDVVSDQSVGTYYVHKKNCLAAFPFGVEGHYADGEKAFNALHKWLHSRKDSATLRVTLIEQGE
jgi:hypothetical protein